MGSFNLLIYSGADETQECVGKVGTLVYYDEKQEHVSVILK